MSVKQFAALQKGGRSNMGGGWHNAHETATAGLAAYPSARREAETSAAILRGLIATLVVHQWQRQDHLKSDCPIECNVSLYICL